MRDSEDANACYEFVDFQEHKTSKSLRIVQ